jgi:lipid-binding SYLF domain-containing protein
MSSTEAPAPATEPETPAAEPEQPVEDSDKKADSPKAKSTKKEKKPSRGSMEGMILNANKVLDQALKPGIQGLPKNLFEECLGIILISIAEAGFIFSANVGSGIAMTKNSDGTWSAPCAVGLTGMGFGLLAGASVKDVFMFLMDEETVNSVTGENGLKIGAQGELTIGVGRNAKGDFDFTGRGVGVPISIAYTKGIFGGFNLEGAVVGVRHKANKNFYGHDTSARDILLKKKETLPADKTTKLAEVYDKLEKCAAAATADPVPIGPVDDKKEETKATVEATDAAVGSAATSD